MTYQELHDRIAKLTEEQRAMKVHIFDDNDGEFYSSVSIEFEVIDEAGIYPVYLYLNHSGVEDD